MANSSGQTTRARSIVTLDGYVSRGRAPPPSVPRDHAMLQDFAVYLELRLKSQNLSILRRIFADFLNEQENTLVHMMQQGCTIITVFPVLRTSEQRRQRAKVLLQKPKFPLDSRGCVFSFLQYRTATRNMGLLEHLFLEFGGQRETALMQFVQRGCEVISVIPFKLPRFVQVPPPVQESSQAEEQEAPEGSEPATAKETEASLARDAVATTAKQAKASLTEISVTAEAHPDTSPKAKRKRKRKVARGIEKPHRRGKPVMSDDMCRSQLELVRRLKPFEAQIPWKVVFSKLPAPFDEVEHTELSKKYREFWSKHARAVWERNFWSPMSRKLNLLECNKRSNRQLTAKNGFEKIIISAYQELGAEFFVVLDSQKPRHPGWWYRGPVVALFALQQVKSEAVVWDYVENQMMERFPSCKLPLPLKASNSAAVLKCHTRDSDSMWMANNREAPEILNAIAVVKAKLASEGECEV